MASGIEKVFRYHRFATNGEPCVRGRVIKDCLALLAGQVVNQPQVGFLVGNREHPVDLLKCTGDAMCACPR